MGIIGALITVPSEEHDDCIEPWFVVPICHIFEERCAICDEVKIFLRGVNRIGGLVEIVPRGLASQA